MENTFTATELGLILSVLNFAELTQKPATLSDLEIKKDGTSYRANIRGVRGWLWVKLREPKYSDYFGAETRLRFVGSIW